MLDSSVFLENSGVDGADGSGTSGGAASHGVAIEHRNEGGSGDGGEDINRNSPGNRWPREETLALLEIRSDMDRAFRDAILKAPLWDEVSRKLGELGYNRSAKKCKEKFENIYKYHKRTKEGRSSRQNGKNYRFFELLEVFDNQLSVQSTPLNQVQKYLTETRATAPLRVNPLNASQGLRVVPCSSQDPDTEFMPTSTSSSEERSEGIVERERKLAEYFERLMKDVLKKQEDLQNKFLEAIEKYEKDRIARDEAWKVQEMARIKREQDFLAQERAISAAKDAAVLAFLQKISQHSTNLQIPEIPFSAFGKHLETNDNVLEKRIDKQENGVGETSNHTDKQENSVGENTTLMSSSRWPKAEVEALIMLRTDLDLKYNDNGPKGPLWEEISSAMKKLGYDRSAKRCKEKWENINKYYKRVKDSKKRRPQDSKTCPYFNLLESIYAKKSRTEHTSENLSYNMQPESILLEMMGQQKNQPPPPQPPQQHHQSGAEDGESENQNQEDNAEDEEDDDNGDGYQIVTNIPFSLSTMG
ncbi:trihelix transcription factor GT-2-like [Olea europaea subsp. europaea]|uniref:Trihelix transcription factor GT-2-like n=1 Tax=Olea europaea subsp. europaea TaxID=158383 RepID=A0A8S0U5C7_OLEEU|nr:trihelix transcription factor GT-2-like [Olea europaea subsp. europaea]